MTTPTRVVSLVTLGPMMGLLLRPAPTAQAPLVNSILALFRHEARQ